MKAVVYKAHGGPENIAVATLDDPAPPPGDVLVRVRAVALNGFDPMILAGIPGLKTPMPHVPGGDIAGEVAGFGEGAEGGLWKKGQRVLVNPYIVGRGMMGETARGGACELVSVPSTHLLRIPDEVSFEEAAALPSQAIIDELGIPLSAMRVKCAVLGLGTLKVALHRGAGTPLPAEWGADDDELVWG